MSISEERERRQIKVFMKWINSQLKQRDLKVESITEDFDDGVNLINLYEIISDEKLPRYIKNPKTQFQKVNNLSIVLKPLNEFVKECGIGLQYSPSQVENGDAKQILGLIWIIITKFVLPESEESKSRKKALLKWVQKVTEPYDNVAVKNFTDSWCDGLAFNALLHQFENDLMDYDALGKEDAEGNCKQAFDVAEELGITRLLDIEDVVDTKPDEKSVMMYVSLYYQHFHKAMGEKLKKAVEEYKIDAKKLLDWIAVHQEKYSDTDFSYTLEEAKEVDEVDNIKFLAKKAKWGKYKSHLYMKLAEIQKRQAQGRLEIYVPSEEHSFAKVNDEWLKLSDIVSKFITALNDYIAGLEEDDRQKNEEEARQREEDVMAEQEKKRKEIEDELQRIMDELEKRKAEQAEIQKQIENEQAERQAEREKLKQEYADAREKSRREREKLTGYEKNASDFMHWIYETQSTLTKLMEKPIGDNEEIPIEDEETDEETKNKRAAAIEDAKEKVGPILEEWEGLVEEGCSSESSVPKEEIEASVAILSYALTDEDSEILKEIRKFKMDDEEEEGEG